MLKLSSTPFELDLRVLCRQTSLFWEPAISKWLLKEIQNKQVIDLTPEEKGKKENVGYFRFGFDTSPESNTIHFVLL